MAKKIAVLTPFERWNQAREHGAKDRLIAELRERRAEAKDKDEVRRLAELIPALEAMTRHEFRRWLRRSMKRQRAASDQRYTAHRAMFKGIRA